MNWKPIDADAKDGRPIIAWCVEGRYDREARAYDFSGARDGIICTINWDRRADEAHKLPWRVNGVEDRLRSEYRPTHWMTPPDPPA